MQPLGDDRMASTISCDFSATSSDSAVYCFYITDTIYRTSACNLAAGTVVGISNGIIVPMDVNSTTGTILGVASGTGAVLSYGIGVLRGLDFYYEERVKPWRGEVLGKIRVEE